MRRWFILLMIVLLPVRGWAGEFIGIQMALAGHTATVQAAMPEDCPMHAAASAHHGDDVAADDASSDSKCSSCQLCTPAAQLTATPLLLSHAAVRERPFAAHSDFASASLAPAVEPPIS